MIALVAGQFSDHRPVQDHADLASCLLSLLLGIRVVTHEGGGVGGRLDFLLVNERSQGLGLWSVCFHV